MGRGQRNHTRHRRVAAVAAVAGRLGDTAPADDPAPSNRSAAHRQRPQRLTDPILTSKGRVSILSYPELMREWNYEKNSGIDPAEVSYGSKEGVHWRCAKGHDWEVAPGNRSGQGSGCPYCGNKAIDSMNSLRALRPDLAQEWHPTKNGEKTPDTIGPGHSNKVWWQ